jgi:hypothetical protein
MQIGGVNIPVGDSATAPTSTKYDRPGIIKKILLGGNYRKDWSVPVTAPILHLSRAGFKFKELGGGQQTKSLQLEDSRGREWALRSVDKEVTIQALPKGLRNKTMLNITQDMVSAAHPHAALVVGDLARTAGVVAPYPGLFYIADDPVLGGYSKLFVNTFCYLEEREPTPDNSDTKNTEKLLESIREENDHLMIQKQVLRARFLDMLVGDWDRHADQWRWGVVDSASRKYYYAIPRDRDQAFFFSRGFLLSVARVVGMKHFVGFRSSTRGVRNLSWKSWGFDKNFINELTKEDWIEVYNEFYAALTDEQIARAVRRLPVETYAISGPTIERKIKSRREGLKKDAIRYYHFISKNVHVYGSDEAEIFTLAEKEGNLTLVVTDSKNKILYQRRFDPGDTKVITLDGLAGADQFMIDEGLSSSIRLIINGGKGKDLYDLKGKVRSQVFDYAADENEFRNQKAAKVKFVTDSPGS